MVNQKIRLGQNAAAFATPVWATRIASEMSIVAQLWQFARRLSVRSWLGVFGAQRRSIADQVADQLIRSPGGKSLARHLREETARERKAIAADGKPLVKEIRAAGYRIDSLHDLIYQEGPTPGLLKRRFKRRFVGPYRDAYPILARHLFLPHQPLVRRCIAAALAKSDVGGEIETQMLGAMNAEPCKDVRASMASSVWCAMGPGRAAAHPEIGEILDAQRDEAWQKMASAPGSEMGSSPWSRPLGPIGPDGTKLRLNLIVGRQTGRGVEVTPVGEGLFRLEHELPLVEWCEGNKDPNKIPRYGDTIVARQVGPTTISYVSIHARGPYRHYLYVLPLGCDGSIMLRSFLAQVDALGGHSEVHMKGRVVLAIPQASEFDVTNAINQAFTEARRSPVPPDSRGKTANSSAI